jgi:hypothetical protein
VTIPKDVDDAEEVASFVLESSKFKGSGIDWRQLMPSRSHGNTSVHRIDGLSEDEIADAGHVIALQRPKLGILGWGVLIAKAIRLLVPLSISAREPPPRHAQIEDWPAVEDQRALAMDLARTAKVTKRSTVP